jgi:hypothetical protein
VIDAVLREQEPMRERARMYVEDPQLVRNIIADGCEKARKLAQETMRDVREAIGTRATHERTRRPSLTRVDCAGHRNRRVASADS